MTHSIAHLPQSSEMSHYRALSRLPSSIGKAVRLVGPKAALGPSTDPPPEHMYCLCAHKGNSAARIAAHQSVAELEPTMQVNRLSEQDTLHHLKHICCKPN